MAKKYLDELEKHLAMNQWRVFERRAGKGYAQAGHWIIGRPDHTNLCTLTFSCAPDRDEWNIKTAIGCDIKEIPYATLYFAKGHSWRDELDRFMKTLNDYEFEQL